MKSSLGVANEKFKTRIKKTKTDSLLGKKHPKKLHNPMRYELKDLTQDPSIDRSDYYIFLAINKMLNNNFLAGEIYSYIKSLSATDLQKSDLLTPLLEQIHENRVDLEENIEYFTPEQKMHIDKLIISIYNNQDFRAFLNALKKQTVDEVALETSSFYFGKIDPEIVESELKESGDALLFRNAENGEFDLAIIGDDGQIHYHAIEGDLKACLLETENQTKINLIKLGFKQWVHKLPSQETA